MKEANTKRSNEDEEIDPPDTMPTTNIKITSSPTMHSKH
jgi:hypothetical protein